MYFSDLPSHILLLPFHNCSLCVSPLPCDPVEWVCSGECVLFQWHADWVIYGPLSARLCLLLGKSRRGATTSLFSPDPMMSGLSAPSLKLCARHPSCWSGSHRNPIGCEPQLDLDWAAVSAVLICIRPEDSIALLLSQRHFIRWTSECEYFTARISLLLWSILDMLFNHVLLRWTYAVDISLCWCFYIAAHPWGRLCPSVQSIQHINSMPYLKLIFSSLSVVVEKFAVSRVLSVPSCKAIYQPVTARPWLLGFL